ncbi:MAG: hypothetical protein QF775_01620 [archaeon]|nr:hypothetical protein [archaeon]
MQSALAKSIFLLGKGSLGETGKFETSDDKMNDKPSRYMTHPLSNEAWNEVEPNRFELLRKLKKAATENIEKDEDWSLNPFLKTMHDQMFKNVKVQTEADKRRQEKARRREEHERRVQEAQERKLLKGKK